MDETHALFKAVYDNDGAAVTRFVKNDRALVRVSNRWNLSVLQFARFLGRDEILRSLVDAGPALDVFEAAMLDDDERVRTLVEADGSLASTYDAGGFTALHMAAFYGAPRAALILLDLGADVHARTKNFLDNMPLHAAAAGAAPLEMSMLLLDRGADANAAQHGANTPLHTAAFRGDRALVDRLLAYGGDARARSDEGKTPAEVAASQGYDALATLLDLAAS